jgi:hypothetical protein
MQEEAPEHRDNLDPHFSNPLQWLLTLEPLRDLGVHALSIGSLVGLPFRLPILRELEIHLNNSRHDIIILKSDNVFGRGGAGAGLNPIPSTGTLVRASFDLLFHGEAKPRILHIRPPHLIQLLPSCDLRLLWPWLRTFRVYETIAKALVIALVLVSSLFSVLADYDDDTRHHPTLVARR